MAVLTRTLLTWSNALTASRLVSVPFFYCALLGDARILAAILFWIAVATDFADGRVARARGETSPLGGLLDHATDASFVTLGLTALAQRGLVPTLLPLLVVAAFVQYVLDSRSLAGRPLRTSRLGRWNGVLYFVPPGAVVTRDWLGLAWPTDSLVHALGLLLVGTTLVSIADRAWTLLRSQRSRP